METSKIHKKNKSGIRDSRKSKKQGERGFIKSLANDTKTQDILKARSFSDTDLQFIKTKGKLPERKDYQVHPIIPLDDGGTHDFKNVVLIQQEPYHAALTAYQNSNVSRMSVGSTIEIEWPMIDALVYP